MLIYKGEAKLIDAKPYLYYVVKINTKYPK